MSEALGLGQIFPQLLTGNERLPAGATLLNFWQWMGSDLVSNALRGTFAEYLVSLAVGVADGAREEWVGYDVRTPDGIKIEVKTSGYIQSWHQTKPSDPRFDIAPKHAWDPATNEFSDNKGRSADVYVFCVHHHLDQPTINPLDMAQWTFYILPTVALEREVEGQKSISLNRLRQIGTVEARFNGMADAVRNALA